MIVTGAGLPPRVAPRTLERMKRFFTLVVGLFAFTDVHAQSPVPVGKPQRPISQVEHMLVIGIDGLRPDRLLMADAPNLRGLMKNGAYTMWAKTTALAVTLPSFTSMLTGVNPRKHKIDWDRDMPLIAPFYPRTPTIFELASNVGYVTAMASGKSKFCALNKPGTIAHYFYPVVDPAVSAAAMNEADDSEAGKAFAALEKVPDATVVAEAGKIIEAFKPHFFFVHLPQLDMVGHKMGWGSPEQLEQIGKTDALIGELLAALTRAGIRETTAIIVSADHGGAGLSHGPDDPRSRTIPWILQGPGVRKNFDLTQIADLEVRTEDTCATACWLLGLALPANFDGHPVAAAFLAVP